MQNFTNESHIFCHLSLRTKKNFWICHANDLQEMTQLSAETEVWEFVLWQTEEEQAMSTQTPVAKASESSLLRPSCQQACHWRDDYPAKRCQFLFGRHGIPMWKPAHQYWTVLWNKVPASPRREVVQRGQNVLGAEAISYCLPGWFQL